MPHEISKIIAGGSFDSWFGNSRSETLKNIAISLSRDSLAGLVSNLISNAINKFERKKMEKKLREQEKDLLYLFQMKIWMIL